MTLVNPENIAAIRSAYAQGLTSGSFAPSVFVIEPTNRCQLACTICPRRMIPRESVGDMPFSDMVMTLDAISDFAEVVMLYFMGEPLLHPRFADILDVARSRVRGSLVISTNAMALDCAMAEHIVNKGVDLVICCIDRWDKTEYERVRLGAKFETAIDNTVRLIEMARATGRTTVIVKALDLKMPEDEKQAFEGFWRGRGAIPVVGWIDTWAGALPHLLDMTDGHSPYHDASRHACADLWFKMVISWSRDVVLCCHDFKYDFCAGRISDRSSIMSIWQSTSFVEARAAHIQGRFSRPAVCGRCLEWASISEMDAYLGMDEGTYDLVF